MKGNPSIRSDQIQNGAQWREDYPVRHPVPELSRHPLERPAFRLIKRGLDILISALVLVFMISWLLPALAFLIWVDSGFPVFFVQKRIGRNNQLFYCYKLRTMTRSIDGTTHKISKLSRILRYLKLDEIPQFFNVLRGEMSVVGPRPHMMSDHLKFIQMAGETYQLRHLVKPGITGLAQIKGFEGPITSDQKLGGRIWYDLYYIQKWSIRLEIQIIWQTFVYMVKFQGLKKFNRKT